MASIERVALLAGLSIGAALAQGQDTPLSFEAASVRAANAPARFGGVTSGGPGTSDPERITFTGVPMIRLLMIAYGLPLGGATQLQPAGVAANQVSGPPWMEGAWYDINAKVPPGASKEQVNRMLQTLLTERFGLALHHETREISGYELVVGKGGPKLKPTADPNAAPVAPGSSASKLAFDQDGFPEIPEGLSATRFSSGDDGNNMHVTGRSQSIADLIRAVIATSLNDGKRVVDKTGLTGKYDFKMDLDAGGGFRRPALPPLTAADPRGPDIFSALDKLGLKLQKAQIPLDFLVIDHLEKTPSER